MQLVAYGDGVSNELDLCLKSGLWIQDTAVMVINITYELLSVLHVRIEKLTVGGDFYSPTAPIRGMAGLRRRGPCLQEHRTKFVYYFPRGITLSASATITSCDSVTL